MECIGDVLSGKNKLLVKIENILKIVSKLKTSTCTEI
jgi:hypothetical protein